MEFSIVEGKRLHSFNFTSERYRYTKYRESNGVVYLRCTLAKQCTCGGLAKVDTAVNLWGITREHNHSQDEYKSDSIVLANRIKRKAESSTDNLREMFNNESRNSSGASSLTFKKIECTLLKRRLEMPKLPSSPEEFVDLLLHSSYSMNYRLTIRECNETAVVFATDLMISKLIDDQTIHFDATFKVVPRLFYQLFTIFISYKGHAIPAIHILMTAKSEQLYRAVLSALHEFIPNFKPTFALCDFEKASRNAFTTVFPNIILVGCWFHYTKALTRKYKSWVLVNSTRLTKYSKHRLIIMSLPFLVEEDIQPTYLTINLPTDGLNGSELELINSFKKYLLNMDRWESKLISILLRD